MVENDELEQPQLRPIEIIPIQTETESALCLQDPEGMAEGPIFLSESTLPILNCLDGEHTIRDIQSMLWKRGAADITREELESFLRKLNDHLFLNTSSFQEHRQQLIHSFQQSSIREPAHAGETYPETERECRQFLEELLENDGRSSDQESPSWASLSGLIAPHIDLERGRKTYARTYGPVRDRVKPELFVIFGTSHQPMDHYLCPLDKDYATPIGTVPTASEPAGTLLERLPGERKQDMFRHRNEHSIEFQALFLAHLLGERRKEANILPILCSSFMDRETGEVRSPEATEKGRKELRILNDVLSSLDREPMFIASADLAHVGQRYGDQTKTTDEKLNWLEREDRDSLAYCRASDPEKFLHHVARNNDQRRVCGLPPIYFTLKQVSGTRGKLVEYRQAVDRETDSTVSFAGMYFLNEE